MTRAGGRTLAGAAALAAGNGAIVLSEEIVSAYERLVPIAAEQVARLRRGDLDGFEALLAEKERMIGEIAAAGRAASIDASGPRPEARLTARAEEALRRVLANEDEALAILFAARDRASGELMGIARVGVGLRSYGSANAEARVLDRRG
jgi:hypothetical protein